MAFARLLNKAVVKTGYLPHDQTAKRKSS